jgi:small-conductance mechanosensitive channel
MAQDAVTIQLPPDASPDLIARVKAAFPDAIAAPAEPPAEGPLGEAQVAAAEEAVSLAAAAAPRLPDLLGAWWDALPGGGWWVLFAVLAATAAGYAAERLARGLFPARPDAGPTPDFRVRVGRALRWFAGRLAGIALFALVALLAWRLLVPVDAALAAFARSVLFAIVRVRVILAVLEALSGHGAPGRRLMGFDDAAAAIAHRATMVVVAFGLAVGVLRAVLDAAVGVGPEANLARIAMIAAQSLATLWFFLRVAAPVRALLMRGLAAPTPNAPEAGEARPGWVAGLAKRWHWVYLAALAVDFALKALGVLGLLGPGAVGGAGNSMLIMALAPLAIAGLHVWRSEAVEGGRSGLAVGLFALAEGAVIVAAGLLLLRSWGVDPYAPDNATGLARLLPGLVEAAMVLAAGFAVWRAVAAVLATRRAQAEDSEASGEEGGGAKGTRLDTVLPVLRGFALALVGVTTLFMALTALGVNIAPLLASAGVVGLAIGFGAQRMVADVISGLLYLYEDAFRVGEYIEVSGGKGAVERISIRSVRLRHPRGPVYTIPFSAMGTVQNHSRDWATMKFNFMVSSDTDVEMVRKVVKKVGEQMMADPDLQGKIIVPLKSQGAVAISGAAFTIGLKFTAKPGEQFAIRRRAFAALQKALKEKGIELYRPELTLADADPAAKAAAPV